MQGSLAQLLSLAAYGNEFLSGRHDESYFPNGSAFRFCKSVRFMDLERSGNEWKEKEFAENPNEWFASLKDSGVIQLRVRYMRTDTSRASDRMSAGFVGGGGRWQIQAIRASNSDLWEAGWEVGDKDAPDQNIWHVKYGRVAKNVDEPERVLFSIGDVKATLYGALTRISEFAHKHNHANFGETFDRAVKALSDPSMNKANGYKVFPSDYANLDCHQILSCCQTASVFGGMGSWNDMGFEDSEVQKEYEKLSDDLFTFINLGFIVATNPPLVSTAESEPVHIHKGNSKKWWQLWK